jgi:integrase
MANFTSYKTDRGEKRFLAVVRIKGFKRTSKAFDSMGDAKDWAQAYERELRGLRDRGGARADVTRLTVKDLVTAFLGDPKTQGRKYYPDLKYMLGSWVDEYGSERLRSFGYLQIVAFRDKRLATGLTPARVNRYLSGMRRCWNWGSPNYTQTSWPQKVMLDEPKPEAINHRYGTDEATAVDVNEIFKQCDVVGEPLGNLVRFLVGTGARLSDALAVRWRDVDSKTGSVAIRGQKTGKPSRVAMLAPALDALKRASTVKNLSGRVFWQFEDRRAPRYLWESARKQFPEALRKARLHDCRHVELAAQLGHSTLTMVKRYAHLAGGHRGAAHDKFDAAFAAPVKK